MSDPSRTRRRGWLLQVLAVLLLGVVFYLVSFGPACWILSRTELTPTGSGSWSLTAFHFVYQPVANFLLWVPDSLHEPINWYLNIGSSKARQMKLFEFIPTSKRPAGRSIVWIVPGYTYTISFRYF